MPRLKLLHFCRLGSQSRFRIRRRQLVLPWHDGEALGWREETRQGEGDHGGGEGPLDGQEEWRSGAGTQGSGAGNLA